MEELYRREPWHAVGGISEFGHAFNDRKLGGLLVKFMTKKTDAANLAVKKSVSPDREILTRAGTT